MSRTLARAVLICVPFVALVGQARAQWSVPTTFIFENFLWSRPGSTGLKDRISWIYGEARFNDSVKLVGSYLNVPIPGYTFPGSYGSPVSVPGRTLQMLDEGYVEVRVKDKIARLGRFRTRFGLGDWSELFYTPIAQAPMVRNNPINSLGLLRFDTGFDVQGGKPELEYQIALVDVANGGWQVVPRHLDHGALRVQTAQGGFIIGLNALSKFDGGGNKNTMAGVDLRWSADNVIVRAEFDKGFDSGANAEGAYVDVFYRPQGMFRTQLGARAEYYKGLTGQTSHLTTVGLKQILSAELVLNLNYGWGSDIMPANGMRGWTIQLMTAVRF